MVMSVTLDSINELITDLTVKRDHLISVITSMENAKRILFANKDSAQPTEKPPKCRQTTTPKDKAVSTEKAGKKRYNVSQKDIVEVLGKAEFPLSAFSIVVELAKVNIQVLEPALLKILKLGESGKKFHLTSAGKWSLAQDD